MRPIYAFGARFDLRRLHRDEGGNIIVLYIAAALLLIGMLWAIIGTGQRVVQKETLQASADAAAFSTAVIKAKGMNIIAFCNLLMALLLAIVILLRLLKQALFIAAMLVSVASIFQPELSPLAAELQSIANQFSSAEGRLEQGVLKAMQGISKLERVVKDATPALALVEGYKVGTADAYKANFGAGTLVSLSLPLPIPGTVDGTLPAVDGTWAKLCAEAERTITAITQWVLEKVVGSTLASWVSKALNMILGPFEDAVCGGGGSVDLTRNLDQVVTDCGTCASTPSSQLTGVLWTGVTTTGQSVDFSTGYFPSNASCPTTTNPAFGEDSYSSATFVKCVVKNKPLAGSASADMDHPLPLELRDDWAQHNQVRGFTVLTDANMHNRRRSVGVDRRGGAAATGEPLPIDAVLTMAQAEFISWNHHDDLWHMDWRARLVPFSFGNASASGNQTGDTTGTVSAGALQQVGGALTGFLNSQEGQLLTRQFLIH